MFPPPVGVGAAVVVVHPAGVGDGVVVGMGANAVGLVMPMVRGVVTDGVGRAVGNIVVTTGLHACKRAAKLRAQCVLYLHACKRAAKLRAQCVLYSLCVCVCVYVI